jgi:hypothetical protein
VSWGDRFLFGCGDESTMELVLDPQLATVTLLDDWDLPRWTTRIDAHAIRDACFREAFIWLPGGVACVGAAEHVWFFNLESGAACGHIELKTFDPWGFATFGHFGHATLSNGTSLLIVMTYAHVIAVDATLSVFWIAKDVAVDGIRGADGCSEPDQLTVDAEMDPPGGWFRVLIDARDGREIARSPQFLPCYSGIYGSGPDR